MASKEYKCVQKTKRTFQSAIVELSKEQPLNKVSVKQVCERAEMSRNAFYFHYEDINSLIKEVEDTMIGEINSMFIELREIAFPDNVLVVIEKLTDYFINNRDATLMLTDSTYSTSFTKRIDKEFSDFFFEYYKQFNPKGSKQIFDFFYGFVSNGFCGMLIQWLHNPEGVSKRHFIRLAYTFVHKLLVGSGN